MDERSKHNGPIIILGSLFIGLALIVVAGWLVVNSPRLPLLLGPGYLFFGGLLQGIKWLIEAQNPVLAPGRRSWLYLARVMGCAITAPAAAVRSYSRAIEAPSPLWLYEFAIFGLLIIGLSSGIIELTKAKRRKEEHPIGLYLNILLWFTLALVAVYLMVLLLIHETVSKL